MSVSRIPYMSGYKYLIDSEKVPSVTTIIGKAEAKPALTTWASRTVASYAVDHWRELTHLPVSERLKRLSDSLWADRDSAALKGTQIHKAAEKLAAGADPATVATGKHAGQILACAAFLSDFQVQPLYTEVALFSRNYSYAGTADLICRINDRIVIVDWKTSRSGVYPSVSYQLSAYAHCDTLLDGDTEKPMPHIDRGIAVHLREDGYSAYPAEIGDEPFDVFQAFQVVAAGQPENYLGVSLSSPMGL